MHQKKHLPIVFRNRAPECQAHCQKTQKNMCFSNSGSGMPGALPDIFGFVVPFQPLPSHHANWDAQFKIQGNRVSSLWPWLADDLLWKQQGRRVQEKADWIRWVWLTLVLHKGAELQDNEAPAMAGIKRNAELTLVFDEDRPPPLVLSWLECGPGAPTPPTTFIRQS